MLARQIGVTFAGATLAFTAPAAGQVADFSQFIIFGDSLVDAGNVYAASGGRTPNPAIGYFPGRFTNGYNWNDLLSIAYFGAPTVASLQGGTNFAYGGARVVTNADVPLNLPDLTAQLGAYAATLGPAGAADPDALYILNLGANDIFALGSGALPPGYTPEAYFTAVAGQYAAGVQALNDLGARNIFVTGIPVANVPAGLALDARFQSRLDGLSLSADTTLYRYSYIDFFTRLQTDPGSLGLGPLDTTTPCFTVPGAAAAGCPGYFQVDGTHPTAAVHVAIAQDIARQFNFAAVPEPASWAMMIAGFAAVGTAMRRRVQPMEARGQFSA